MALGQAGRAGWNIGQAINPYVQPTIASAIDAMLLPTDMRTESSTTVPYPERKRGKFTCICRANKDGRSPDNCSINDQNFAMGYGEGSTLTEAKRPCAMPVS
jgi:hypothetical protein